MLCFLCTSWRFVATLPRASISVPFFPTAFAHFLSVSHFGNACIFQTLSFYLPWWLGVAFFSNKTCLRCIQFFKTCYYTLYRLQYLVNVTFPMYWETRKFTGLASLQSSPYCGCWNQTSDILELLPEFWLSSVTVRVIQVLLCWVPTCVALNGVPGTLMNKIDRVPQGVC